MTAYKITQTNTGLDTIEKVRAMAELMIEDGFDVEFAGFDALQGVDESGDQIACPVSEDQWLSYLEAADEEA
ncbi:hypothetical protein [Metapseudomonas otitidis]|uniref:hypothetical protein n=1 Tax=Metapseudomonas otitidis TaxID=319939 RepID=UPI00244BF7A0|nr:hypothetical protein [Pseudomonas otitidis]MDG9783867.1 hypothetical protein [Pseudomonas otitidis]